MFCFGCGLIGHNVENCRNSPLPIEGGTNPKGAWLRSRSYGRRIHERTEKTFSNNPLKSISGGQFSLMPKGLMEKMVAMSLKKQSNNPTPGQNFSKSQPQQATTTLFSPQYTMVHHNIQTSQEESKQLYHQGTYNITEKKETKRRIGITDNQEPTTTESLNQSSTMASLEHKASQST